MRERTHQGKPPFGIISCIEDFYRTEVCIPPRETKKVGGSFITMFFSDQERPISCDLMEIDIPGQTKITPETPTSVVKVLSPQGSKEIFEPVPPSCSVKANEFVEWNALPGVSPIVTQLGVLLTIRMNMDVRSGLPELLGAATSSRADNVPTHILTSPIGTELAHYLSPDKRFEKLPSTMVQLVNICSRLRNAGVVPTHIDIGSLGFISDDEIILSDFLHAVCCNSAFPCISNTICHLNSMCDAEMALVEAIGEIYANMLFGMRVNLPHLKLTVATFLCRATPSSCSDALKEYFKAGYQCDVSSEECKALLGMLAPHPPLAPDTSSEAGVRRRWNLSEVVDHTNRLYNE